MAHTCIPSTGEAEAKGSGVQVEASLGYIAKPYLKNTYILYVCMYYTHI
jgi:desulfoferrodoxin (superoxide reductase-like protein)